MADRPEKCHATKERTPSGVRITGEWHAKGCRRGRPLCRWKRATNPKRCVCRCEAYHFPHRDGGGACRYGIPAVLLRKMLEEDAALESAAE